MVNGHMPAARPAKNDPPAPPSAHHAVPAATTAEELNTWQQDKLREFKGKRQGRVGARGC